MVDPEIRGSGCEQPEYGLRRLDPTCLCDSIPLHREGPAVVFGEQSP